MARRATLFVEQHPGTALSKPGNVGCLVKLALYHLIFYCDNSLSMKSSRFTIQRDLVLRMADVATKVAPANSMVDLRFIHPSEAAQEEMTKEELFDAFNQTGYKSGTPIGTMLGDCILEPIVYKQIESASGLSQPLLVCVITDGQPNGEKPLKSFREQIALCKDKLVTRGYMPTSVMFCVSQIGNDPEARKFLDELNEDARIRDVLHCTTDRLDEKYRELKDNHDKLDEWLLNTLSKPVMLKQESR